MGESVNSATSVHAACPLRSQSEARPPLPPTAQAALRDLHQLDTGRRLAWAAGPVSRLDERGRLGTEESRRGGGCHPVAGRPQARPGGGGRQLCSSTIAESVAMAAALQRLAEFVHQHSDTPTPQTRLLPLPRHPPTTTEGAHLLEMGSQSRSPGTRKV